MSQPTSPTASPVVLPEQDSPDHRAALNNSTRPVVPFKARSISFAGPSTNTPPQFDRRISIQFAPSAEKPAEFPGIKSKEPVPPIITRKLRNHSPPPPSTYHPRVSFDTFNNSSVPDQEFTLVCKHNGYTYGRHQRVFLVAIDQNAYSEHALKWVIEDMIEDGDEIICLRVVEPDPKTKEGSTAAQMLTYKEDTKELLRQIQNKNDAADKKAISIIMEFAVGSVEQIILHMIHIYSPAFLTVGTRGKSLGGLQGLLPGSVSKWCVQNSPVPVVVVRHPDKRRKKMDKRQNDPKRKGYAAILDKSAAIPGGETTNTLEGGRPIEAEAGEAEAVAKAVGFASNIPNRKGKEVDRDGNSSVALKGGSLDATANDMNSGQEERGKDEYRGEDDEADEQEEEEMDDEEEDSDDEAAAGVMYAEGLGIEHMPNYVGKPDHDVDDDVEGLNLDDEEDHRLARHGGNE